MTEKSTRRSPESKENIEAKTRAQETVGCKRRDKLTDIRGLFGDLFPTLPTFSCTMLHFPPVTYPRFAETLTDLNIKNTLCCRRFVRGGCTRHLA